MSNQGTAPLTEIPHSPDMERAVLGAILVNPELIYEATAQLRPDDFFLDSHRRLFRALCRMHDSGAPLDELLLVEELRSSHELEIVGGAACLSDLATGIPRRSSIAFQIGVIREMAQRRAIIIAAEGAMAAATADEEKPAQIIARLEDRLLEAQSKGHTARQIGEVMQCSVDKLELFQRRASGRALGLTTTLESVDEATTAIREDELWIIGARPNVGKTPFGCQIAIENARQGVPVLVFSLEMADFQLGYRVLSHAGFAKPGVVRDPRHAREETWQRILSAPDAVREWPLFIDDTPGLPLAELKHRMRYAVAKHGVRLVVLDYVQLVGAPGKNGYERVSNVARGLQHLCRQTHCPIVALSQLNREAKDLAREPLLGDLRESGELEQNANVVLLLHRPPEDGASTPGIKAKIIAAKVREGRGGSVNAHFDETTLTFKEGWPR